MRVSPVLPNAPAVPEQAGQPARLVAESTVLQRLWQGESYGVDTATTFAQLAGRGIRPAPGTAVMLTTLQRPARAALPARSPAVISGRPMMYCVGPGSRNGQRLPPGAPDPEPAARTAAAALNSGPFRYGSAAQTIARMRACARCGIDEIALRAAAAAGHGVDEALNDIREILSEWSIADVC